LTFQFNQRILKILLKKHRRK